MATLESDTFIRTAVGAGSWGTATDGNAWTIAQGTTSGFSTDGTHGIMTSSTAGRAHARVGSTSDTDQVVTADITPNSTSDEFGVNGRQSGLASGAGVTLYRLTYNPTSGGLILFKSIAGTPTQLGSTVTKTISGGTKYSFKLSAVGTSIQGKMWTGTEPGSWDISVTDSSISSGAPGLTGNSADATGIKFENFLATDGSGTTTSTRTITATAALLATSTHTITSTAALLATSSRTITATAALLATATRSIPSDAALTGTFRSIACTAALLATKTRTVTSTAALLQPKTRTITATSALRQTSTRTITATAALYVAGAQMTYADAQDQYSRLKATTLSPAISMLALVYFPPAVVLNEYLIPAELDVLLAGETWSDLHTLRSIDEVTAFIDAH